MRVLVLGAGFGGLELTTRLSNEFGDDTEILLIDSSDGFVFGFSKLDVMFERLAPTALRHRYRDLVKPGVRFIQTVVRSIDPVAKRVETDAGTLDSAVLVIALGADLDPGATPGLVEGGCLRAGWYSNDRLDNLGRPSAMTIPHEHQHLEIGQWVPMSPSATPSERTASTVNPVFASRADEWDPASQALAEFLVASTSVRSRR